MAENTLKTVTAGGTQTATQSPQDSVQAGNSLGGQSASDVQSGTATSLLNSGGGIVLNSTPLTTVNLSATGQTPVVTTQPRHIHPVLFGFSALLLVIAVALFWSASRSAKNTTN